MQDDTKKYYRALIKAFGGADYSGCLNLAKLLAKYDNITDLQILYNDIAIEQSSTPTAVERSIRVYIKSILRECSIEDLSVMLDYAFKPNKTVPTIGEFVPVFKLLVDEESTAT